MDLFLDSADLDEIRAVAETGLIDGVTTNPSLIAKSGRNIREVIKEICNLVEGPVSAEVTATDSSKMIEEGNRLREIAPNVTVKVPLTKDGLIACDALTNDGAFVNVTLCFSAGQALLAAKAGATFISPFLGRLDDLGYNGLGLVEEIRDIYDAGEYNTAILAASIRSTAHVVESAKIGADVATVPGKIFWQLYKHPLTDKGLNDFLQDWEKTGQSIL